MRSVLPLSALRTGDIAVVEEFDVGRGLRHRLLALGIVPGAPVRVVRNDKHGPIVICVKDSRVMLGRGMADKITVATEGPAAAADKLAAEKSRS